jgi:acetyltransferase-like isoleucine patch superfamily enzyme
LKYLIQKWRFFLNTFLESKDSHIFIDPNTKIHFSRGSQIIIKKGILKIGGNHPRSEGMPSLNKTIIFLGEGCKLIVEGDAYIASGSYICLKNKSNLILEGGNYIGADNKIFTFNETRIGKNTSTSWNVTLMEDDGHDLYFKNGTPVKKIYRKMIIDENVGIQMNVTIPRGVTIGANSLIGANSVIRKDIPKDTLVYSDVTLKEKHGFSAGLQFN